MKWEKLGEKKNPFVDQNPKCHLQGLKINDASMNLQAYRGTFFYAKVSSRIFAKQRPTKNIFLLGNLHCTSNGFSQMYSYI